MDKEVKNQLAILNLAGELSPELSNYFAEKQILIINPESDKPSHKWSHILTKDVQDFNFLSDTYKAISNEVKIISLTPVDDLQHFVASNGKLILDEVWLKGSFGSFILDKFFQEYGGITLRDNYPAFQEKGSFNITNPFNTGEYLDRLVHSAYQDGMSGLSIKTFFDHLVMYLTGLKTQGKIGMPIEVMYGYFEDVFAVQLHFYTKNLLLEDVTSSLSSNISKKAEKYLLNIAVQSSDFFDFTLLSEVNKTVITGLWTKDERIKTENRGLLFNELTAAANLTSYPTEGVTSFQSDSQEITDFSDKVVLSSKIEEDNFQATLKGLSQEEEEVVQVISGSDVEEEIIQVIQGNLKEEEAVFKISGSKDFDVDKFVYRISAGIEEKTKGSDILKVKSLQNGLPDAIKSSFNAFASKLNKSLDQITDEDLKKFKENEIPRIIKESTKKVDAQVVKISGDVKPPPVKKTDAEKALELKINGLKAENETLKSEMKTLVTEVKILKDSKAQMALIQSKASEAAASSELTIQQVIATNSDQALKTQIIDKMIAQKSLNEEDTKKLSELVESESKLLTEAKENENQLKKMQIETIQKETFFTQEMEKLNRTVRAKDLVVQKSKESLTKLADQKNREISFLNERLNQASQAMLASQSQNQGQQIRDLEKQIVNHEKMIEIYKTKIIQKPSAEFDDSSTKNENKRLQMANSQMKNQIEMARKEVLKFQDRMSQDSKAINLLKVEKAKLEQQVKKSASDDAKRDGALNLTTQNQEKELKKLLSQQEQLANELKESHARQKDLEAKLADALKNQKKEEVPETPAAARGKMAHLENNVRKLIQDLIESRNQTAEMKKDTMKLRHEKTAIQNVLDQTKKELDKIKEAAPKKPGAPGKAA
jgi:hypothetical protein